MPDATFTAEQIAAMPAGAELDGLVYAAIQDDAPIRPRYSCHMGEAMRALERYREVACAMYSIISPLLYADQPDYSVMVGFDTEVESYDDVSCFADTFAVAAARAIALHTLTVQPRES